MFRKNLADVKKMERLNVNNVAVIASRYPGVISVVTIFAY